MFILYIFSRPIKRFVFRQKTARQKKITIISKLAKKGGMTAYVAPKSVYEVIRKKNFTIQEKEKLGNVILACLAATAFSGFIFIDLQLRKLEREIFSDLSIKEPII
jgi:hypothetical protein